MDWPWPPQPWAVRRRFLIMGAREFFLRHATLQPLAEAILRLANDPDGRVRIAEAGA
jgi:hypothetical protein